MLILKNKNIYVGLLVFFIVTYWLRMFSDLLPDAISAHASNFALSGIIFLAAGFMPLLKRGFSRRGLLLWMLPLALANIIVELFVGNFNTADPLDMVFGVSALAIIAVSVLKFSEQKTEPKA